jgi:hypothetical protein
MFDELEHLRACADLRGLLAHYAQLGAADRDVWQDRLMEMKGAEPRALIKLHGELIGFGWIEQNTGFTTGSRPGFLASCYRITGQGQRALRQALAPREDEDETAAAA